MRSVCVFCGSRAGARPAYAATARAVGEAVARRGMTLVYGGGDIGLMGEVADAATAAGGTVIGIIPRHLLRKEIAHQGLSELLVVDSMHIRKATMNDLSDGFVVLPGGYGTWEEWFETVTWAQLGLHRKPCGVLNAGGFYDPMLRMVDQAVEEGFVDPEQRRLIIDAADIETLLDAMERFVPLETPVWLRPGQQ